MPTLTRDDFFAAKPGLELVNVPSLGGDVYVRCPTAAERDEIEESLITNKKKGTTSYRNWRAKNVAKFTCDAEGNRIFSDADVPALGKLPITALQPIYQRIAELSNITEDELEELVGNSEATQS